LRKLFVIAGPSGSGKGTIINELLELSDKYCVTVSHTSREPRAGEKDGQHYYFISRQEFERLIKENFFVEYELVHDNYYGTSKEELARLIDNDKIVLFDIDVKGALSIKRLYPQAVLIFLNAPNEDTLISRLKNRDTETKESLEKRLETMRQELALAENFEHKVINDRIDSAVNKVENIINRSTK